MGHMRHHTIVVSGHSIESINLAREVARVIFGEKEFGDMVSDIVNPSTNDYMHFFIAPDGSKEGWNTSTKGDEAREQFKLWINEKYRKGHYLSFVECFYADDDGKSEIVDHSKSVTSQKIRQETE